MSRVIKCYSESLNSAYQWEADTADTFEMATAVGNNAWPEMLPAYDGNNKAVFGLLAMGEGISYPFSFAIRGFPDNASNQVTTLFLDDTTTDKASFLTFAELEAKSTELLVISDAKALAVRPEYLRFLKQLPEYSDDPKYHRIVFWFTDY